MVLYRYSDRDLIYSSAELQKWLLLTLSTLFFFSETGCVFQIWINYIKAQSCVNLNRWIMVMCPKSNLSDRQATLFDMSVWRQILTRSADICKADRLDGFRLHGDVMDGFPLSLWEHDRKPAELWPLCRLTGDLTKEDWGVFLDFTGLMEFYEVSCCSGSYYNNI